MRCDPRQQRKHFRRQQHLAAAAGEERSAAIGGATVTQVILLELGGGPLSGLRGRLSAVLGSPVVLIEVEEHEISAHYAEL